MDDPNTKTRRITSATDPPPRPDHGRHPHKYGRCARKPPPSDPPGSPPCTDASRSMVGGGVKVRAMEALASEDVREMSAGPPQAHPISSCPPPLREERGPSKDRKPQGTEQEKAKADSTARDAMKRT